MRTQQDAAHFLDYLLQASSAESLECSWRATNPVTRQVHDTGLMPLRLDLRPTLQECVDYWHEESSQHLHVLDHHPRIALLRISRYRDSDPTLKDLSPIQLNPGQTAMIPCLAATEAACWAPYRLACLVCHLGNTLLAGHYRTAITTSQSEGVFQFYVLDDSARPQLAKRKDLQDIATGSYLLGLYKCE